MEPLPPPAAPRVIDVDASLLRGWPLPMPGHGGDKEVRGHLLIVGGSREMPGAVILAANAALRAGAGKLSVASAASVAPLIAMAIPESRVIGLAETADGGLRADAAAARLGPLAAHVDALLIGPGMLDDAATCALVGALLPLFSGVKIILDAAAMGVARAPAGDGDGSGNGNGNGDAAAAAAAAFRFAQPVLLTPHAGEMAMLTGQEKSHIQDDAPAAARQAAQRWNAIVALKGACTLLAAPDGSTWRHQGGNVGLAISGSGDTLAGIITGLAARGASLEQAGAWGVALHAMAGEQLALRFGQLGYLAREIGAELPALLRNLAPD